jgi:uncharacterized protein (TIGR00730 family)
LSSGLPARRCTAARNNQDSNGTKQQNRDSRADEISVPYSSSRKIVELQHSAVYASPDALAILTSLAGLTGMSNIRRLCVYCGSSGAVDRQYREAATELGARLAAAGIGLVYGGGRVGLMGLLADAVLAGGGEVIGIIPARLRDAELAHPGATELVVVETMHERKRLMAEKADAFAVLPGGIGTLDELFEILSWKQLGLHDKPILVADIGGYWAPLRALLDDIVTKGFARPEVRELLRVVPTVAALIARLEVAPAPPRNTDSALF